jgi:hypothetical protein
VTISDFGVENGEKKTSKPLNFSCLRKKKLSEKNRQNKNTGFATLATSQN